MSQKHDASKGAYKRILKTGVTADRFSDYFAEFCARTYRDEKFEFTEIEFEKYYNSLQEPNKDGNCADASDFIHDLSANMCLMYYESQKYHFTHRSFQEYFCALYFSKQKDRTLPSIGDFFEKKSQRNYGDKTFHMLYDMIPEKVEEYIIMPFLTELFNKCDKVDGYWTFLEIMYLSICYTSRETKDFYLNSPQSFLYDFITTEKRLEEWIADNAFPHCDAFVTNEWVYLDENWRDPNGDDTNGLIDLTEVPSEYIEYFGEPDVVGWNYEFNISDIRSKSSYYSEFLKIIEDDNFALKKEYNSVREYVRELQDKQQPGGDDLFYLFY